MAPIVVAAIIAGAQIAGTVAANAATNAQTKNTPKIKELRGARMQGQLTKEGEAEAMAGRAQELQGIAAADQSTNAALGQLGATSGRDIAAVAGAKQAANRDASTRFTDRWADAFKAEGQELEDRKAIRRDRTNKMISTAMNQAGAAVASAGSYKGATDKGPKGGPDWKAIEKQSGKDTSERLQKAYNTMGEKEFNTMATEVFGAEMAEAYKTAYGTDK